MVSRRTQFVGYAGLVFIAFGGLLWNAIEPSSDRHYIIPAHFVIGGLLLLLFLLRGGYKAIRDSDAVGPALRRVLGLAGYITLFICVIGVINYIAARREIFRIDTTDRKVFTLAPQTEQVITALPQRVVIRSFVLGGRLDPASQELIDRLTKRFPEKLRFLLIDPEKNPAQAERFGISQSGTSHFSFDIENDADSNKRREVKSLVRLEEQEIVNALLKLTRGEEKTVCYVSGHGEPELHDNSSEGYLFLKEAIEGENLTVKEIQIAASPGDLGTLCSALIVAAPERELLASEREQISRFMLEKGGVILLHEPNTSGAVRSLAEEVGITVGNDVIVQDMGEVDGTRGGGFELDLSDYGNHAITSDFGKFTQFELVSSVRKREGWDSTNVTELVRTSARTWAETDVAAVYQDNPQLSLDPGELKGPISVAAVSEPRLNVGTGIQARLPRVVVFGDADFVNNDSIRSVFNRDFFLNSLNWCLGESKGITLRAKTMRGSIQRISGDQIVALVFLTAVFFPELLLLGGLAFWLSRRQLS